MSSPRPFPGSGHHAQLRASDADRDQAVAQLGDHHVAGRLDLEEFTERVSQALASKTLGELGCSATCRHLLGASATGAVPDATAGAGTVAVSPPSRRLRHQLRWLRVGQRLRRYGDGTAYASDWPLLAFLGWGAAVAWQGVAVSRQRGIARPNG